MFQHISFCNIIYTNDVLSANVIVERVILLILDQFLYGYSRSIDTGDKKETVL